MARCQVKVEGRTLEVEASSLHHAAICYNAAQISGFARDYPRLTRDTVLTVQVEGGPVHTITWGSVLDWANRIADENSRRWAEERAKKASKA